ncbi:hypothetical protein [Bradyrhizobium sp. STM 3557]|uniref:hypothetical protein n=1 Tax=Bradyrhizobium sp. STM 3557 TaxID=578920 RepID=UPI0038909AE6
MLEIEMRRTLIHLTGTAALCQAGLAPPALADPEWIIEKMSGMLRPDVGWAQIRRAEPI